MNKAGVGEPALLPGKVAAKDLLLPPEMEIDASLRQSLKIKAGGSIRLFSTYRGNPIPTITWRKDGGRLPDRAHVDTTDSTTLMLVENAVRYLNYFSLFVCFLFSVEPCSDQEYLSSGTMLESIHLR